MVILHLEKCLFYLVNKYIYSRLKLYWKVQIDIGQIYNISSSGIHDFKWNMNRGLRA